MNKENILICVNAVNSEGLENVYYTYKYDTNPTKILTDLTDLQEAVKEYTENCGENTVCKYPVIDLEAVNGLLMGDNPKYKQLVLEEDVNDADSCYVAVKNTCVSFQSMVAMLTEKATYSITLVVYVDRLGDIKATTLYEGEEFTEEGVELFSTYFTAEDYDGDYSEEQAGQLFEDFLEDIKDSLNFEII